MLVPRLVCDMRAMSHKSALFHTSLSVHSLAGNSICKNGNMEGLNAIIAVLPKLPNLSVLK